MTPVPTRHPLRTETLAADVAFLQVHAQLPKLQRELLHKPVHDACGQSSISHETFQQPWLVERDFVSGRRGGGCQDIISAVHQTLNRHTGDSTS
jgi:hypothetical protein